ncbi:tetratricopeptide repeat protein [Variovorax defluvii]|uniref:tetratricopeptide repeat protein n=1 Tax=Variovorax defluvii TaxID=913761 RepID=UPI0031ED70DB
MQLLAQIGFFAAQSGQRGAAAALFSALRVVRPEAVLPWIGLALADMGAGRAGEAARFLRDEALRAHPADPELCTFLGLALIEAGHLAEARKVLQELVDRECAAGNEAQPHVRMASRLLQSPPPGAGPAAARSTALVEIPRDPSASESTASPA